MKTSTPRLARVRLKQSGLTVHVFDNPQDLSSDLRDEVNEVLAAGVPITGFALVVWNKDGDTYSAVRSTSESWAAAKAYTSERIAALQ